MLANGCTMPMMARMRLRWRLSALVAIVASLVPQADASSRVSAALAHCQRCMSSGGVVDLYSQSPGEKPSCLARGRCPPGSQEVYRTCVAPADPFQARQIVVTLQVECDRDCISSSGVEDAGVLWLAIARLLRVPLQETHAAMLLMDTSYQNTYPLEHFTLLRSNEQVLFDRPGSVMEHSSTWDLFLAIRVHSARAAASGDALRTLLGGDTTGLTNLAQMRRSKVHVFAAAERRTTSVQNNVLFQPMFKLEGLAWNQEPPIASTGSSSSGRRRQTAPTSAPAPPPAAAPAPAPAAPSPTPHHEGCDRACQTSMIGDGRCDAPCSNAACGWDGGDCGGQNGAGNSGVTPGCGCGAGWLGNGICESFCNYEACHFDGGDCVGTGQAAQEPLQPRPTPAPAPLATPAPACGCNSRWLGDGICDSYCNTEDCSYDGGDCPRPGHHAGTSSVRNSVQPAPSPVQAPTTAPGPAPGRAPAPAPTVSASSGQGNLRATASPPQAFSNSDNQGNEDAHVVSFGVENTNNQQGDETWRIVATEQHRNAPSTSWYADNSEDEEDERSTALMSALILAIFFVATALLGGIAVCLVTRHTRFTARRLAMAPKARTDPCCRTAEGWTFEGWGQPSPSGDLRKSSSRRWSNSSVGSKASGAEYQNSKSAASPTEEPSGRRMSKQSSASTYSWKSDSTRASTNQDNVSSPSSFGSNASSRAQSRNRDPHKEPKVYPEPETYWNHVSAAQQRMSESQTSFNRRLSEQSRRNSKSAPVESKPTSGLQQAASAKDPAPQPPPPPPPPVFRNQGRPPATHQAGNPGQARSQSKESVPSRAAERRASEPTASTPKAPERRASAPTASTPKASQGLGAESVSRAKTSAPKASEPKASTPKASEPKASTPKAQATPTGSAEHSWFPSWGSKSPAASEASKKDASRASKPAQRKEEPPKRSASAPAEPQRSSGWWPWGGASAQPSSPKAPPNRSSSASRSSSTSRASAPTPKQQQQAAKKAEKKADALTVTTMQRLEKARTQPLDERKKIFRDLQRELHPDKNIDQADAAKLAFQRLMEQRASFLAA